MSTAKMEDSRRYVTFNHTFADPWGNASGDNAEDSTDITLSYRFAKPDKTQIQRLQEKAAKNAALAARTLLLDIVHTDDKAKLLRDMDEYPGIATSFSTAIIKGVGISSQLGN